MDHLSTDGCFYRRYGGLLFWRILGKHKLYVSVSPGKTWEGAIGGFLSSLIPAFIFPFFVPLYKLSPAILTLTMSISISGQIGDLAESMLKRNYGVKDSGRILPGHGGQVSELEVGDPVSPLVVAHLVDHRLRRPGEPL